MGQKTDAKALFRELQAEHAELLRHLNDVRRWWKEADDLGRPNYEEMGNQLQKLRDMLVAHFADEERGGYLAPALAIAPRFAREAAELEQQHARFLDTLDRFASNLKEAKQSFGSWEQVRKEFDAFVEELQNHERAENKIMQAAFGDDIGPGD